MELAPDKRYLLARQRDERDEFLGALELLTANYQKQCEDIRRQHRKKLFNREITRASRYREEKSFWEYVDNIVEDIHILTWRRAAMATCTTQYNRKRKVLEEELRELETTHRKERITLRYSSLPPREDELDPETRSTTPHFFVP